MTSLSATFGRSRVLPSLGLAAAALAVLTVIRLIGLKFSVVDLFFDESQYWAWSREPAFGYYSKPPLLAWIIAVAENVCGTSEACIRAPAPILYFATSLIVYALARHLYDERVALFAALSLALAPAAVFSARVISTDVPLLMFWALALLAYVKLVAGAGPRWAIVLGVALGLGLLAKYAMVYFLLGAALAACLDRDARALLRRPEVWLALAIAALLVAPNIHWNLTNGFATFRHTGGNIEGSGLKVNPLRGIEFIASQFVVLGPILFAVLLGALARIASPSINRADRLMLAFAIPPLVLITATAIATRAFANWAAPAFISGVVVAVALMVRYAAWKSLAASLAIGVAVQAAFLASDARATNLHIAGFGDVYRRTLGWRALGEETGRLAQRLGVRTIVGDQRDDIASLLYYWRDRPEQVLAWPLAPTPGHHFDLTRALTNAAPMPILFVSRCSADKRVQAQFASVERQGSFSAPTGPTSSRTYYLFKADAPRGPIRPIGPCA
jgi:4-amino-4-deoxy-L-arabinose transferase-like glycosyltransferase